MNLTQYIQQLTGYNEATISGVIDGLVSFIKRSARSGESVKIENFGVFGTKQRDSRLGRNPRTGEEILIPPKLKPTFRFSKNFIKAIQVPIEPEASINSVNAALPTSEKHETANQKTPIPSQYFTPNYPPFMPITTPLSSKIWHVVINGQYVEIPETSLSGRINQNTPVWLQDGGWTTAGQIPELSYLFPSIPTSPLAS